MADDFYEVLGVSRTATQEEIKKAFRKKAHQHHPDKAGGDEEVFKKVNEAYQVLSDENKRSQYDQFGRTFDGASGNPFGGGFSGFNVNFEDVGDIGDIFSQFFGGSRGGRTRQRVRRGNDVQVDVEISFVESAKGIQREIELRLFHTCSRCKGNAAEPGTPIETCTTCQGSGTVTATRQTILGSFAQQSTCPTCEGEGKIPKTPCKECHGEGRTKQTRTLETTIPAGIADGQVIRITGKGEAPPKGGLPGDLFIAVHVKPDKVLTREGNNVRSEVNVSFPDAALGTTTTIKTLEGEQSFKIPAGTQPGSEIRLDGLGFPSINGGGVGDQVVKVNVEVPKRLSKQQKQLLEEFKNTKKKSGWF